MSWKCSLCTFSKDKFLYLLSMFYRIIGELSETGYGYIIIYKHTSLDDIECSS